GIAYRQRVERSFWMRPLAAVFYLSFAAAALWHAPRAVDPLLERFHAPLPALVLDAAAWWERDWARLPAQRRERDASRRWSLELQSAGPSGAAARTLPRAAAGPVARRSRVVGTRLGTAAGAAARARRQPALEPGTAGRRASGAAARPPPGAGLGGPAAGGLDRHPGPARR